MQHTHLVGADGVPVGEAVGPLAEGVAEGVVDAVGVPAEGVAVGVVPSA